METAEHLLATHVSPPLDACTYMGLDSGAQPVQVTGIGGWEVRPGQEAVTLAARLCDLRPVLSPVYVTVSRDGTTQLSLGIH